MLAARSGQVFRSEPMRSGQYLGFGGLETFQAAIPAKSALSEPQTGLQIARIRPGTPTRLMARIML